jgi:NADH-quinone oxidoreductase subunit A
MPLEYLPIAVLVIIATLLAFVIVGLGHLFGPRRPNKVKGEPYESGMVPYGPGQRRMPVHFYLVAVLFILFDIEIVFLLPWAVVLRELKLFAVVEMVVFVVILFIGFVYAWKSGALEWE